MDSNQAARHVLTRAAVIAGGVESLAARLQVRPRVLKLYISGEQPIPDTLYLQAVDIVMGNDQKPQPPPP